MQRAQTRDRPAGQHGGDGLLPLIQNSKSMILLALFAILTAGCGGGSPSGSITPTVTVSISPGNASLTHWPVNHLHGHRNRLVQQECHLGREWSGRRQHHCWHDQRGGSLHRAGRSAVTERGHSERHERCAFQRQRFSPCHSRKPCSHAQRHFAC